METKQISKMLDEVVERTEKRLNDEFIRTSMEHRKRELAKKQQEDIDVTGIDMPRPPVENQT
jgi:hypothetical protein